MDEKCFLIRSNTNRHAIARKGCKNLYLAKYNFREAVTVIEAICADETRLPPFFIFRSLSNCNDNLTHTEKEGKTTLAYLIISAYLPLAGLGPWPVNFI